MVYDILMIIINILAFFVSPRTYIKFRYATIFKYGNIGYT
jgi:hypothetical protein